MEITIRKALPEDAHTYALCGISCWQTAYRGIIPDAYLDNMPTEIEQRTENFRQAFTDPGNVHSYCVMHGENMVGFITIDIIHANIWAIYLIEEFCGKGYGKRLLDFAVNELEREGHYEIYLWVLEDNVRARRFYEKNNFYVDGTTRVVDRYGGVPLVQVKYVRN